MGKVDVDFLWLRKKYVKWLISLCQRASVRRIVKSIKDTTARPVNQRKERKNFCKSNECLNETITMFGIINQQVVEMVNGIKVFRKMDDMVTDKSIVNSIQSIYNIAKRNCKCGNCIGVISDRMVQIGSLTDKTFE